MTPGDLAALHAAAMRVPPPWKATDFAGLLAMPGVFLVPIAPSSAPKYPGGSARGAAPPSPPAPPGTAQQLEGFALGRVAADEAELLTLAVAPSRWRRGIGRSLLAGFEAEAGALGARRAFLEVAVGNTPARALYRGAGYAETGTRRGYYRTSSGTREDAVLMAKDLA